MLVIFWLSAQPDMSTGLGTWDTVLRKGAHMTVYGLLWVLWWRALRYRHAALAVVITLAYAVSDEIHQSFVDGRHGAARDVAIDALGVGLAGLAVVLVARRRALEAPPPDPQSQPRSLA